MQEMPQEMDIHGRNLPRRPESGLRTRCLSKQWPKKSPTRPEIFQSLPLNFEKNTFQSSNSLRSYLLDQATRTRPVYSPRNSLTEKPLLRTLTNCSRTSSELEGRTSSSSRSAAERGRTSSSPEMQRESLQ